ncbi:MAG: hypothetical protein IJS15_03995 [Victivallales bacterium]|nr:hypothetical protein [Victivallales bacterium]
MDEMDEIKSCPGSVVLEEYRDGTASPEWTCHIDNCANCQRRIASLDLLDLRVRKVCQPPDGIAARIKAAVHEGREPSIRPMPFWRIPGYRVAAAALLALLISIPIYIIRDDGRKDVIGGVPDNPPVVFERHKTGEIEDVASMPEQRTMAKNGISAEEEAPVANKLPSPSLNYNLRLAGTNMDGAAAKRKREVQKQPLGGVVRHIWSVKDKDEAREFILKVAKANDRNVAIEREDGGFRALIELKDSELQQLVDMLDGNGWRLLSPYVPQPHEADAIEFKGTPVKYDINAIEDGK